MPNKNITIIDGHPDRGEDRYCRALVNAYTIAAASAGHRVRRITLAHIEMPILRSQEDWEKGDLPAALRDGRDAIKWADHLVIVYPLWLGSMPALLKAFFEQLFRPRFAFSEGKRGPGKGLLGGKSARLIVTMGTPSFLFRLYFLGASLASLRRGVLRLAGIGPIRTTLIGGIEAIGAAGRARWLRRIEALGRQGK
jgi:putative NADPH-quinone reductase